MNRPAARGDPTCRSRTRLGVRSGSDDGESARRVGNEPDFTIGRERSMAGSLSSGRRGRVGWDRVGFDRIAAPSRGDPPAGGP